MALGELVVDWVDLVDLLSGYTWERSPVLADPVLRERDSMYWTESQNVLNEFFQSP